MINLFKKDAASTATVNKKKRNKRLEGKRRRQEEKSLLNRFFFPSSKKTGIAAQTQGLDRSPRNPPRRFCITSTRSAS